jgi:hypothetical protein
MRKTALSIALLLFAGIVAFAQPAAPVTSSTQSVTSIESVASARTIKRIYPETLYQKAMDAITSDKTLADRRIACLVDFSKPSYEKRLWIVDLKTGECLLNTWVSHGKGTGRSAVAQVFSNVSGSECSSLGRFVPREVFDGKHGLSLRLSGLDKGINDLAEQRGIIFHAAEYVNEYNAKVYKRQGNSQGCFAVPQSDIKKVINLLKGNAALILASGAGS